MLVVEIAHKRIFVQIFCENFVLQSWFTLYRNNLNKEIQQRFVCFVFKTKRKQSILGSLLQVLSFQKQLLGFRVGAITKKITWGCSHCVYYDNNALL